MVTERYVPVSVELVYLQSMGKRKISGSICFFGAPEFRLSEAIMIEEMGIISSIHACSYGPLL
jgi:hypothetical protein